MIGRGLGDERLGSANEAPGELRIWLIALGIVVVFFVFFLRLFWLQILEGEDLRVRSQRNSVRNLKLEAPRGEIVDREGRVLATTRPAFRVRVIPNDVDEAGFTYTMLGDLLAVDGAELEQKVGRPTGRSRFHPVVIDGDLSYEQRARVETHRYALAGVVTDMTPRRDYLGASLAAHLLGMIGEIDAHELEEEAFADYRPGEIIGKFGLEARLESHLRGRAGGRSVVVDVAGRELDLIGEVEPAPGGRVVLTLDLDLQRVAEEAFRSDDPEEPDKMGALVAIDPRNGEILAMVSRPAYDPNAFAGGIDLETWSALVGDQWKPLRNRAIASQYPPGSTYKAIVAVAGLAEGKIDPEETVFCPGWYRMGRRVYRCWKRGGHGEVDLDQALSGSCDVYFYTLGVELGIDTMAKYAAHFGLGKKTGVGLAAERPGLIPTREWKERTRREAWIKGETVSAAIGQGFNLVTPIQLANAFAALGNDGRVYRPRLVKRFETWDGDVVIVPEIVEPKIAEIDPAVLARVRQGLAAVVNDLHGTGGRARVPGVVVAGKTGTSQVVALEFTKDLEEDEIPIRFRDHALFAAFAPVESPEIAVAVVVEHAKKGGGTIAAPIAQKVLAKYFEKHPPLAEALTANDVETIVEGRE
ncbi:MAG: penicillin-binding protein 2 [Deltaproteobacteria bacterium]|nr:penicillin-binding protein 2 [Deltaproteobacteria bacterium]MBW2382636.1 penicillin-binding protein 2 [Deltaproteobacteria bacterium]MBW2694875.1 penicillin-binding protein 2 [Deltaproteobacteria bacterium]